MNEEKKKAGEMTFKAAPMSEESKRDILVVMKEEGFTEEQLNEMPLEQVVKLYIDSVSETMSSEISKMARVLEGNPQLASMFNPWIRRMNRKLEELVDSLERELASKKKEGIKP